MTGGAVISDCEAAWLAGILEGEGSFCVQKHQLSGKVKRQGGTRWTTASVRLSMTDRDIVERVAAIAGRPDLVRPERQRPSRKQMFIFQLTKKSDVLRVCTAIYPWMGERRQEQIDRVLDHLVKRAAA